MQMQWLQDQWSQEQWAQQQWPPHQQQQWTQPPQQQSFQGVQGKGKGGKGRQQQPQYNNQYLQSLSQRGMNQQPQYNQSQRNVQGQKGKGKNAWDQSAQFRGQQNVGRSFAPDPRNQSAGRWNQSAQFKGQPVAKGQKGKGKSAQPKGQKAAQGQKGQKGKGKGAQALKQSEEIQGAKGKNQRKGKGAKGKGRGKGAKGKGKGAKGKSNKWQVRGADDVFTPIEHLLRKSSLLTTGPLELFPGLSTYDNCVAEKHTTRNAELGPIEVLVFEPPEMRERKNKRTNNLVICFDGMKVTKGHMAEWTETCKLAKLVFLGCTVMLPNIQMSAGINRDDVAAVMRTLLRSRKTNSCVLIGKLWGVRVVTQHALDFPRQVRGLQLWSPVGAPPPETQKLKMPALLISAQDDVVLQDWEFNEFSDALNGRSAKTTTLRPETGKFDYAKILSEHPDIANSVFEFTEQALERKPRKETPAKRSSQQVQDYEWSQSKESVADNLKRASQLSTVDLESIQKDAEAAGGYVRRIATGNPIMGPVNCVFFDPPDKKEEGFVGSGILCIIEGRRFSSVVINEWVSAAKIWGEIGLTTVMIGIEMSPSLDLDMTSRCLSSVVKTLKQKSSILVGKGWGGNMCIELAVKNPARFKGLVLVAPCGPVIETGNALKTPTMLLWAKDDPIVQYSEAANRLDALNYSGAPTVFKSGETGGHDIAKLMSNNAEIVGALKHFVASVIIMSKPKKTSISERASQSLPDSLKRLSKVSLESDVESKDEMNELAEKVLPTWLNENMTAKVVKAA